MMMVLVSQAIHQSARISMAAQNTSESLNSHWGKGWSVRELFENLSAPPEAGEKAFIGSPDEVSGFSTLPLNREMSGVTRFELQLVSAAPAAQGSRLIYREIGTKANAPWADVAHFEEQVEFFYQNDSGISTGHWPPVNRANTPPADKAVLPRAIGVRRSQDGVWLQWYAFEGATTPSQNPGKLPWEQ
ncbi:hypothetical protein HNQ51_001802 [Inhella inkyongensis]|uniref:Uncharacterized protein n=1 Tax=Inhella inkyongensis TaxID=392593 RepID=A0A840S4U1_9BURK|nr:hypothetical protein [Inhella inkyongensis]